MQALAIAEVTFIIGTREELFELASQSQFACQMLQLITRTTASREKQWRYPQNLRCRYIIRVTFGIHDISKNMALPPSSPWAGVDRCASASCAARIGHQPATVTGGADAASSGVVADSGAGRVAGRPSAMERAPNQRFTGCRSSCVDGFYGLSSTISVSGGLVSAVRPVAAWLHY
jgi:hypothetical protein